jgi:acetolactate synthase-1/2/3 large subunit
MKAAELLVRCLESEGVEFIFGIPGEENIDVMDALLDSRIRFVTTRHEQGAAFMADVYGRLTGRAGVCMATLGPGATNLVTAAPTRTWTARRSSASRAKARPRGCTRKAIRYCTW